MSSGRRYRRGFIQPKAAPRGWVIAGVLLVLLLVGGSLWWLWSGLGHRGASVDSAEHGANAMPGEDLIIWFASRQEDALVSEKHRVPPQSTAFDRAKASLQELSAGPKGDALRTLSAEVNIRELFIDNYGTAYVDFSQAISQTHPGGPWAEMLTLRSVMQTLMTNVPEIKRVQILIEGREVETLAGHVDIRRPLDTTWVTNQR
jgi:spore germination protein GerM